MNLRVWGEHCPASGISRRRFSSRAGPSSPLVPRLGKPRLGSRCRRARAGPGDAQAVQIPAHQFVEHRVVFRGNCSRRRAGRRSAPATPSGGSPRRSSHRSARTSDREKLEDAKEHPGRRSWHCSGSGSCRPSGSSASCGSSTGASVEPATTASTSRRLRRDRAGPHPLARQAGHGPGLERVHRDALRLTYGGRYKATPVTTERPVWGRHSPRGRCRPPRGARRRSGCDGLVRGARRAGRRRRRGHRGRPTLAVP